MKIHSLFFISIAQTWLGCGKYDKPTAIMGTTSVTDFKPASFSGADRFEKMKPAFSVIDKIFKDHFQKIISPEWPLA